MKANRIDGRKINYPKMQYPFIHSENSKCEEPLIHSGNEMVQDVTNAISLDSKGLNNIPSKQDNEGKDIQFPYLPSKGKKSVIVSARKKGRTTHIDASKINYKEMLEIFGIEEQEYTTTPIKAAAPIHAMTPDTSALSDTLIPTDTNISKDKNDSDKLQAHCYQQLGEKVNHLSEKVEKLCDVSAQSKKIHCNLAELQHKAEKSLPFLSFANVEKYSKYAKTAANLIEVISDEVISVVDSLDGKCNLNNKEKGCAQNCNCTQSNDKPASQENCETVESQSVLADILKSTEEFLDSLTSYYKGQ